MKELDEVLKKAKPLSPEAAKAKAASLKEMMAMIKEGLGKDIEGVKKVTVASNTPEGIKAGLEKAKEIVGSKEEGDLHNAEESLESPEEEASETPAEEKTEDEKIAALEKQLEELKAKKKGTELADAKKSIKSVF